MTPTLTYPLRRLLAQIEKSPGLPRSELGRRMYAEMSETQSLKRVSRMVKVLVRHGLVELDTAVEGSRYGVQGLYRVGQPRPTRPGYLGVFGWVD